jgi:hypothetical protein
MLVDQAVQADEGVLLHRCLVVVSPSVEDERELMHVVVDDGGRMPWLQTLSWTTANAVPQLTILETMGRQPRPVFFAAGDCVGGLRSSALYGARASTVQQSNEQAEALLTQVVRRCRNGHRFLDRSAADSGWSAGATRPRSLDEPASCLSVAWLSSRHEPNRRLWVSVVLLLGVALGAILTFLTFHGSKSSPKSSRAIPVYLPSPFSYPRPRPECLHNQLLNNSLAFPRGAGESGFFTPISRTPFSLRTSPEARYGGTELEAGDTIPLGRDRILRVVDVRPGREPDDDPLLVVESA